MRDLLDALVFSSALAAAVAFTLVLAAAEAMGVAAPWPLAAMTAAGTILVYGVDRLRDVDADRETAPARTRFVERHRRALALAAGGAAIACALLAWQMPPRIHVLLAAVLAAGLLHRRLKETRFAAAQYAKAAWVTGAWVAVTVGAPALAGPEPQRIALTALVVGCAIAANVLASNLRGAAPERDRTPLATARGLACVGIAAALLGPAESQALALVPATMLAALTPFRASERYLLVTVDGALLLGGSLALACLRLMS